MGVFFQVIVLNGPLAKVKNHAIRVEFQNLNSHSKSCRKYKNQACRYNFRKNFTDTTIVAVPLPSDMPEITKK